MGNVARRHHTVPRFYLDGFAQDGRLGTVRLPGDQRFVQSTVNATAQGNFYSIPGHPDGEDVFEKALSELEGSASAVIDKVVHERVWPLDEESRGILAAFLTVQYVRGPERRRHMEQIAALMTQMEVGMGGRGKVEEWALRKRNVTLTTEQADQVWEQVKQPGGPPIRLNGLAHAQQIAEQTPKLFPYFAGRPWVLVRFQRRALLTCDTPLFLMADEDHPEHEGVGLMTAWGITFPLTRQVGLILASPEPLFGHVGLDKVAAGNFDHEEQGSTQYAKLFNANTLMSAREWLFHHPDDEGLIPDDLPEPVLREVDADTQRFVRDDGEVAS